MGRQELKIIWTTDFVGMAARAIYAPTDNLRLVAFGVDSFEGSGGIFAPSDGDAVDFTALGFDGELNSRLYKQNLYGAALFGEFGGLKAELWGTLARHRRTLDAKFKI